MTNRMTTMRHLSHPVPRHWPALTCSQWASYVWCVLASQHLLHRSAAVAALVIVAKTTTAAFCSIAAGPA